MPLLRAKQVQVVFLEMQPQIVASSSTHPADALRRSTAVVTRIARDLDIPILASAFPLSEAEPELIPELAAISPIVRNTVSLFSNEAARVRLESSGRNVLALAGVSSEIAVLHTALDARRAGYDVHLLADCCGGLSSRTEVGALQQMRSSGVVHSSISSFFSSLIDETTTRDGRVVMNGLAQLWSWDSRGDETDRNIKTLFQEMSDAWRAGDAARFAAVFAPEARFVAFDGAVLNGPGAIAAYHGGPFETYLAGTELSIKLQKTRQLGDGVFMVSSEGGIMKDGDAQGDLNGLSAQTSVLSQRSGRLQIQAFQNTRVRPIDGPQTAEIWKAFDRAWFAREA